MSQWHSATAKRVLAALLRTSWEIKRETGSHKVLSRTGYADVVFAFHDKMRLVLRCLPASLSTLISSPTIYRSTWDETDLSDV